MHHKWPLESSESFKNFQEPALKVLETFKNFQELSRTFKCLESSETFKNFQELSMPGPESS